MTNPTKHPKIIICVGSGGVGKTTVAASIGFQQAQRGLRVLVLTVDPSKRLKTTMGLEAGVDQAQVQHPLIKGHLSVAILDPKKTFDEFVTGASTKNDTVKRFLSNKLYQQLSTNLSGSQEFTALEKLYSCYESNQYDLIVLDVVDQLE